MKRHGNLLLPLAASIALHTAVVCMLPSLGAQINLPERPVTIIIVDEPVTARELTSEPEPEPRMLPQERVVPEPEPVIERPEPETTFATLPENLEEKVVAGEPVENISAAPISELPSEPARIVFTAPENIATEESSAVPDDPVPAPVVMNEPVIADPGPVAGPIMVSELQYRRVTPPSYPSSARRRGWQGTANLLVTVDVNGRVEELILERSSGYEMLDDAALRAVRHWEFEPVRVFENLPDYFGRHVM